jgi:hypothetical protein
MPSIVIDVHSPIVERVALDRASDRPARNATGKRDRALTALNGRGREVLPVSEPAT